jgi:hypothetical protein
MDTNTRVRYIVRHKHDTTPYHEYEVSHKTYKEALQARDTLVGYAVHYGSSTTKEYIVVPIMVVG